MKIMERKYISKNGVVERTRYAVGDNAQPRRGKRRGNSSFRKQEANFNSALRRVARILNCNFSHESGLLLTLDYDENGLNTLMEKLDAEDRTQIEALRAPVGTVGTWKAGTQEKNAKCEENQKDGEAWNRIRDAAEKQLSLWMRRIKRKYGERIKALMITSDIDHETGELVRIHHHVVFEAAGISWDLLRAEWKLGSVDIKQLRRQQDYTPIAIYLMRQVRRQPDRKKYRVTHGMELPKIEERVVLSNAEIRAPAGANVLERSQFSVESVGQYIRYIPKKQDHRKRQSAGRKENKDEVPGDQEYRRKL